MAKTQHKKQPKPPQLPELLKSKIYKTGQTRGADDDQIYQNRVGRNSTVLIPLSVWIDHKTVRKVPYEKGYIVLVPPPAYFDRGGVENLAQLGIEIGRNALVFYELRSHWNRWQPDQYNLEQPKARQTPLGGHYVARVANTTAEADERINVGYTTKGLKGAGIRLYEYAPQDVIGSARCQLEALFWLAEDAIEGVVEAGMTKNDAERRKFSALAEAEATGLLDYAELKKSRAIDNARKLVCPLCLDRISSRGFMSRMGQAAGRERHDLTVTEINLFHIKELSYGLFNHRPYNLGWGHHHCNVVCKDTGIVDTIAWMQQVIRRNEILIGK